MNKYITLFGTAIMSFVFAYTVPMTYRNPTGSNIGISVVLGAMVLIGLYTFAKAGSKKQDGQQQPIAEGEFVPAE